MEQELKKNLKSKIKEIDNLKNLNSKHPRFKNWHVSTLNILKSLPPGKSKKANEFKKLTFEDTKYHRGRNTFDQSYDEKFVEGLNKAKKILSTLIPKENKKETAK